ncbi:hypothetical protein SAMN05216486_11034 [bacterium JGI 053]|nr:hypothetical protein SAMN05216486_11034 [bacterium JGI 053]
MRHLPIRHLLIAATVAGGPLVAGAAQAQCVGVLRDGTFEAQRIGTVSAPWIAEGSAGMDVGRGLAHGGRNNAWARRNTGWNAIRQPVRLIAGVTYTLRAFVRTSENVRDGYFGFRDAAQHPVSEVKFGPLPAYGELRVTFRPTVTGPYNVFAGFWAPNQDAWIQVDDVRVTTPCNDTAANPVDG